MAWNVCQIPAELEERLQIITVLFFYLFVFKIACVRNILVANKYVTGGAGGEEPACQMQETWDVGLIPGFGRFLGEGNGNPAPIFLPGKSHGQSSSAGCSVQGFAKSRSRRKRLSTQHILSLNI